MSPAALLALTQQADSAFPSGGFAFSQGLEGLLRDGWVTDAEGLERFLRHQLAGRWLVFDRVFLLRAHSAAQGLEALIALDHEVEARSLAASLRVGSARNGLALATSHAKIGTPGAAAFRLEILEGRTPGHLPIVQGLVLAGSGLEPLATQVAAAHSFLAGLISAGVRLGLVGTLAGQSILRRLHPDLAAALKAPPPATPWSFSPLAEIAAQRQEQGHTRLFST
ncbi:MAG: urease accessory UreF family protein [Pseudomonadota bacterium]